MSEKLSPEARRAKYLYNKKYVDAYWERRSRTEETIESRSNGRIRKKTTEREFEYKFSLPELPEPNYQTVSRGNKSDEQYIKALEIANKTLNGENNRLIRLLRKYQEIIEVGVKSVMFNLNNSDI